MAPCHGLHNGGNEGRVWCSGTKKVFRIDTFLAETFKMTFSKTKDHCYIILSQKLATAFLVFVLLKSSIELYKYSIKFLHN